MQRYQPTGLAKHPMLSSECANAAALSPSAQQMATFPTPPSSCLHAHRLQAVDLCSLRVHKRFQSAALARRCLRLSLAPLCPILLPEIEHAEAQQGTRPAQAQRRGVENLSSLYRDSRRFGQDVWNSGCLSQRYQKATHQRPEP